MTRNTPEDQEVADGVRWQNANYVTPRKLSYVIEHYDASLSITFSETSSSTLSQATLLFPDPMNPVEFYREMASQKLDYLGYLGKQEPRATIMDAQYWQKEAHFWYKRAGGEQSQRWTIDDQKYGKCECHHYSDLD